MPVTIDNTSTLTHASNQTANTNLTSAAFTVSASATAVAVRIAQQGIGTLSATYDPGGANIAMTLVADIGSPGNTSLVAIFAIVNPSVTGSRTVAVQSTSTADIAFEAQSYLGTLTSSVANAFKNAGSGAATSTGPMSSSTAGATTSGSLVIAVHGYAGGGTVNSTSDTQDWIDNTLVNINSSANHKNATGGVDTLTSAISASQAWASVICEVVAAAGVATVVGQRLSRVFLPSQGPIKGLRPTQAFPNNLNIVAGGSTFALSGVDQFFGIGVPAALGTFSLGGVVQSLNFVPNPLGRVSPTIFAPGRGPTRGLQRTDAFPASSQNYTVAAVVGTFTISGIAQTLNRGILVSPVTGTYSLGGVAQTLTFVSGAAPVVVGRTTPTIFGPDTFPTRGLIRPQAFPSQGNFFSLAMGQGTFALSGKAQTLTASRSLIAVQGTYTLGGVTQTLIKGKVVSPVSGTFSWGGVTQTLTSARSLTQSVGVFSLSGKAQTLNFGRQVGAAQGTFVFSGKVQSFAAAISILPQKGTFSVNGFGPVLTFSPSGGGGGTPHGKGFFVDVGTLRVN